VLPDVYGYRPADVPGRSGPFGGRVTVEHGAFVADALDLVENGELSSVK